MTPNTPKNKIKAFLSQKHIAVAGYSRDPKKFGSTVYQTLKQKGYNVYAVNPAGGITGDGDQIYTDVVSLPGQVKALLILTRPEITPSVVRQALQQGIDNIWIQQMSDDKDALEMLDLAGINYLTGRCILLHADPTGVHKFHRFILKIFGKLPK